MFLNNKYHLLSRPLPLLLTHTQSPAIFTPPQAVLNRQSMPDGTLGQITLDPFLKSFPWISLRKCRRKFTPYPTPPKPYYSLPAAHPAPSGHTGLLASPPACHVDVHLMAFADPSHCAESHSSPPPSCRGCIFHILT